MRKEFTDFYFKTIFNFIKENKTLVLLLPTLIGSMFQFVSLFLIDYNLVYLRFFSISQVVGDSFIILFLLITNYVLNFYLLRIFNFEKFEKENFKNYKLLVYSYLGSLMILYLTVIFLLDTFKNGIRDIEYIIVMYIIFFVCYYFNCYMLLKKRSYKSYFLIFGSITMIITSLVKINLNYLNFSNNLNIEIQLNTLKKELKVSKIKLQYFNDKYIFYKIEDTGKIYIEKTEDVFNK